MYIYAVDEDKLYQVVGQDAEWYKGKAIGEASSRFYDRSFPVNPMPKRYFIVLSTDAELQAVKKIQETTNLSRSELFFMLWDELKRG